MDPVVFSFLILYIRTVKKVVKKTLSAGPKITYSRYSICSHFPLGNLPIKNKILHLEQTTQDAERHQPTTTAKKQKR
ncbi:hypothetical protein CN902_12470 [Priestia megaterium]|uniref:hypothetical protein n=1 Tax=Priestia megaterium TaxID=1404 RepID=UPI000BFBF4AC|nr:hypothetical protein [Priestia megaterium]PGK30352.1 hypothetical protein CN902_12470 [Priestia megaterium]